MGVWRSIKAHEDWPIVERLHRTQTRIAFWVGVTVAAGALTLIDLLAEATR